MRDKQKQKKMEHEDVYFIRVVSFIQAAISYVLFFSFAVKIKEQYFFGLLLVNFFLSLFLCIHIYKYVKVKN